MPTLISIEMKWDFFFRYNLHSIFEMSESSFVKFGALRPLYHILGLYVHQMKKTLQKTGVRMGFLTNSSVAGGGGGASCPGRHL